MMMMAMVMTMVLMIMMMVVVIMSMAMVAMMTVMTMMAMQPRRDTKRPEVHAKFSGPKHFRVAEMRCVARGAKK